MKTVFVVFTAIFCVGAVGIAAALDIELSPSRDCTLYEDSAGAVANGSGESLFSGRVGAQSEEKLRRGLIAFDVAGAVPAGSTIQSASLQMTVTKSAPGAPVASVKLHRVSADWGEGASNAAGEEGGGAAALPGDATWTKRFFGTAFNWSTPGGDFAATPSASQMVGGNGVYIWTSSELLADLQGWFATPAANFGWIIINDESSANTARRIASKENTLVSSRPVLKITYEAPSSVVDWNVY